jgi:hypothetical protein
MKNLNLYSLFSKVNWRKVLRTLAFITIFILGVLILLGGVRGKGGSPLAYQTDHNTELGGPFEVSGSTSRYALTESMVKDKSFFLSQELAKFSSPDVTYFNGKFLTIFAPGVSFLAYPFYILGSRFGLPQLFAYMVVTLAAFLNIFTIAMLSEKLGATKTAGLFSGFIYLFATNALAYAFGFTQHHLSVLFITLGILLVFNKKSILNYLLFGIVFGYSILLDLPNVIFLIPSAILMVTRSFNVEYFKNRASVLKINLKMFAAIVGIIPPILLFGWYNFTTTSSYTLLAQNIGRTDAFAVTQNNTATEGDEEQFKLPFDTRDQLNGLYILTLSNERAWLFYSPIVLLGILGFYWALKKDKKTEVKVIVATVLLNIILYSMFGDPWGGWAFGARYLIPGAALMCTGIGVFLTQNKSRVLYVLFVLLLIYSIGVNSLGALTTNAVPPKIEAVNLNKPVPYTYEYNWQLIKAQQRTSLLYNNYLSRLMPVMNYLYLYAGAILTLFIILNILYLSENRKKQNA